jgi:hypothetical protein
LALAGAIAYAFSGSSGLGIGWREDPSSRWIFVPLIIIAIVFAWLPPHLDRLDRWTIDGDIRRPIPRLPATHAVAPFALRLLIVGGTDAKILRAAGATAVYKDPADILAHYSDIAC